jgi:hypothetical protein
MRFYISTILPPHGDKSGFSPLDAAVQFYYVDRITLQIRAAMRRNALFFLPFLALALSSCSTVNDSWDGVFGGGGEPLGKTSACPQVAVVRDLSIYQNPPSADESTLIYSARMGNVRGNCAVNEGGLAVNATAELVALRGINGTSGSVTLPFFVSVLDPKDNVLDKRSYDVNVTFDNSERQSRASIPIKPQINLARGQDGSGYRVLVGFELSADQVDANTRFFSKTPMEK